MPYLDVEGARVFWRTDGHPDAPALVLANSLGSDTSLWDGIVPRLMQDHHVIRLDLPGHGASDVSGTKAAWTVPELALHVLRAADAGGAAAFDFVGVSIGGMIGLHLAARSGRVNKLVVSNTAASSDPAIWMERIRISREKGLQPLVSGTMQRWFAPEFVAADSPQLATIREHFLQVDPRGYAGCCAAIRDVDLLKELQQIRIPTLVISGKNDMAMPAGASNSIASAIQGSRHLELPVAHIPHVEDPLPFLDAVSTHLKS
ncbi:3-oxoadipate enol-lactonase [Variovorax sp. WS11]|uniref:alpha/beta fold hydrolase n=1 Tax=Variovorax sp. WS11 TaxID=1105204 RepID=UPI000D0D7D89|nr:alpha/beta fold hydrolase [Variovorax sp. WS11]NDZ18056.1 alpha/beta fold hydrolase [Variovorax sp. WS11]PSL80012.1 3-oxoadipate enol-lactonase [Variovorax sp. WS11]